MSSSIQTLPPQVCPACLRRVLCFFPFCMRVWVMRVRACVRAFCVCGCGGIEQSCCCYRCCHCCCFVILQTRAWGESNCQSINGRTMSRKLLTSGTRYSSHIKRDQTRRSTWRGLLLPLNEAQSLPKQDLRVRFQIIGDARIKNVGQSQSCMVSKLPMIWKQTVHPDPIRPPPASW